MDIEKKFSEILNAKKNISVITPKFISISSNNQTESQMQTENAFSAKWEKYDYHASDFSKMVENQKQWYLELYGFANEAKLKDYLSKCRLVLDAGAGKCYKAAWFAELSPETTVIAADISSSLHDAAEFYAHLDNLFFVQCDIGNMPFFDNKLFDYISCDQVIHHTKDPYKTFQELARITRTGKEISTYVYRKKALPRELLDEYFREYSKKLQHEELMELSSQLTELGKLLSSVDQEFNFPAIPALGIAGGTMTVQRFIYWNFIKCFWNNELGYHNSLMTNFDWYSPSQAFRYSEEEFKQWLQQENFGETYFHQEEACFSGRFVKLPQ